MDDILNEGKATLANKIIYLICMSYRCIEKVDNQLNVAYDTLR